MEWADETNAREGAALDAAIRALSRPHRSSRSDAGRWSTIITFTVVGPPIGALTFFTALAVLIVIVEGNYFPIVLIGPGLTIAALPFAYLLGFVPALGTGVYATTLRSFTRAHYVSNCAVAGALISALFTACFVPSGSALLLAGLVGGVAGAVCGAIVWRRPGVRADRGSEACPHPADSQRWTGR